MSTAAKKARRRGRQKGSGKHGHRTFFLAALGAAALVVVLALLLFDNSDARRYEKYSRLATESYQNGDYDSALSQLRKAAEIQPNEECLMLMADCYEAQGNWELALETLRRMDRNDPTVAGRIAAMEQRRLQAEAAGKLTVAGESYDADTTELVLDGRGLGDGALQEIRKLYALTRLSLADNSLRDLTALGDLGGLTALDLGGNQIRDLTPLGDLSNLRSLTLDRNPIGDLRPLYGLEDLSLLSLRGVDLDPEELKALSAALPACAILTDGEKGSIQISLKGMYFDDRVSQLDLSGLGLRDIRCLSLCGQLKWLDLSDNEIWDLSPLMNLQQLEQLRASDNQIADLRPLIGISSLRRVEAAGNKVTETTAIGNVTGLTALDLSDNPIEDFSGLKNLKNLQTLRLENTGAGDETLPELYPLTRLGRLALDRNQGITNEAMGALQSALPGCSISYSELVYEVELGGLVFRSDEQSLSIEGTELSDLHGFERFDRLETVSLARNRIDNLAILQNCHSRDCIKTLDLSYNQIEDISVLPVLTAVETLDLTGNRISGLQPLMRMTWLKTLRLGSNPLTEEQIRELQEALPDCDIRFS